MLAPSKATPRGLPPTVKVPRSAPSLARSLSTVLSALFTTQILAPSRATPTGVFPTAMRVVRLALYQCRVAIWIGFLVELTTPFCAKVDTDTNDRAKTLRTAKRMDFDTTHLLCDRNFEPNTTDCCCLRQYSVGSQYAGRERRLIDNRDGL